MSDDVKEIMQVLFLCLAAVAIVISVGDCAKRLDDNTTKEDMRKVELSAKEAEIRASKIDSLSAKCNIYYE